MPESFPIIVPKLLRERFALACKHNRVILFHAPCGSGKTVVAQELLKQYKTCYMSAWDDTFSIKNVEKTSNVLLVDDLHRLDSSEEKTALCEQIQNRKSKHIVLLSRGAIPGWLMPFQFSGVLEAFDMNTFLLDNLDIQQMAKAYGVALAHAEISAIQADTKGYPVALAILMQWLAKGGGYSEATLNEGKRSLFLYFDDMVYQRFEVPLRQLLVKVAPFAAFDTDLAMLVSGDNQAGELVAQIQQETSMLQPGAPDVLTLRPIFRAFLLWKLPQELDAEAQKNLYSRAGLYFELRDEMKPALDCYSKAGDQRKISELLIKNARLHVGVGQYLEMEQYYFSIPKEEILRSPTLMAGMSMLCALCVDFDQSEQWYRALQDFAARLNKSNPEYKDAQGRLAYLNIALPQRGSKGLIEMIASIFPLLRNKQINLPTFSVTSTLPSVLNGGKDFSEWTKQDTLLYSTLRKPLEAILGRDGVGLADCAICESFFEKAEHYQPKLLTLLSRLPEIQRSGSPDIEFAAVGLLARTQLAEGRGREAQETIEHLRSRFAELGETRFLPSMDALLCRIQMQLWDLVALERWLKDKAPRDDLRIRALHRYQYFTKAMALLAIGEEHRVPPILAQLLPYAQRCSRTLDEINIHLLFAICYFRGGNGGWQNELASALDLSCQYSYIRPVALYGAAVLPMLTDCAWKKAPAYLDKLIAATRVQAVHYPQFLKPEVKLAKPLTATEQQVLRLLCHNMSNQEICDILGIQLATVKTHVSQILKKLDVSRRSEAKEAAERLGLL